MFDIHMKSQTQNNRLASSVLFLSITLMLVSPLVQAQTLIDRVVAVVNNQVILKSELSNQMFLKEQELANQNMPIPDPAVLQEKVLDAIILERLQLERAKSLNLHVSDEDINQQLEVIAKQNALTLMALRKRLDLEVTDGFRQFREKIKNNILIQKVREQEVINQTYVSETEVDSYLHRSQLDESNVEIELGHILVEIPESASPAQRDEAYEKIQSLHERIQTGEDFNQLAMRYSDGSKALNGGVLGWFKQNDVPTFFANAIAKLNEGDTSSIIQSPSGFHLIKLMNKKRSGESAMKALHLHRFLLPTTSANQAEIPTELMLLSQSMRSINDFNALSKKFPNIPPHINATTDLGWKNLKELPEGLQQELVHLKENRALLPIATKDAWMILFLQEIKTIEVSDEQQRQQAFQAIRMRKANEMFELWLRRLRDEAFIQIRLNDPISPPASLSAD